MKTVAIAIVSLLSQVMYKAEKTNIKKNILENIDCLIYLLKKIKAKNRNLDKCEPGTC